MNLWASAASFGNVEPKVIPGRDVAICPVTLRTPSGAVILGSNVSVWLGPPCIITKMTDLPVVARTGGLAEALMALLAERTDKPVARHVAEDSFIPTGPAYAATMPSVDSIVAAALSRAEGRA